MRKYSNLLVSSMRCCGPKAIIFYHSPVLWLLEFPAVGWILISEQKCSITFRAGATPAFKSLPTFTRASPVSCASIVSYLSLFHSSTFDVLLPQGDVFSWFCLSMLTGRCLQNSAASEQWFSNLFLARAWRYSCRGAPVYVCYLCCLYDCYSVSGKNHKFAAIRFYSLLSVFASYVAMMRYM